MSSNLKLPGQKTARLAPARRAVYLKVKYLRELERRAEHWVGCQVLQTVLKSPQAKARALQAERRLLELLMDRRAARKKKKAAP